jgi:hypothetical protein
MHIKFSMENLKENRKLQRCRHRHKIILKCIKRETGYEGVD